MPPSTKRKRDADQPRVAFHAVERSWERILKEESLDELLDVVTKKLAVPSGSSVKMWRLAESKKYELFDDDDFDAFYAAAYESKIMQVEVQVITSPSVAAPVSLPNSGTEQPLRDEEEGPAQKRVKTAVDRPEPAEQEPEQQVPPPPPKKKKRKKVPTPSQPTLDELEQEDGHQQFAEELRATIEGAATVSSGENIDSGEQRQRAKSTKRRHRNSRPGDETQSEDPAPASEAETESRPKRTRRRPKTPDGSVSETETEGEDTPSVLRPKRTAQKLQKRLDAAAKAKLSTVDALDGGNGNESPTSASSHPTSNNVPKRSGDAAKATKQVTKKSQKGEKTTDDLIQSAQTGESAPSLQDREKKILPVVELPTLETVRRRNQESTRVSANISTQPPAPRRLVTPSSPQSDSKSACPICRKRPMHLRYECLTVKKGPAAIRKRIAALQKKSENAALVDELSLLARNLEMASSSAPGPMDVDSDPNELADMSLQGLTAPSTNGKSRSEQSDFPAEREEDPGSRRRRRSFSKEIVEPEPELEEHPPAFRRGIMRLTTAKESSDDSESGDDDSKVRLIPRDRPPRISVVTTSASPPSQLGKPSFTSLNATPLGTHEGHSTDIVQQMIHKDVSYSPTDRLRAPPMISSTAPHSPKPANSTSIVEESDIGEVPSEEQPELDPIEPMTELEHYTSTSASRASPLPLPRKKREASSAGKPWKALSKLSAKATRDFSQLVGGKDPSIGRNERAESPQFSIAMPPPPDSRLTSPAPEQSSQISLAQWATMGNRRHSPSDLGDSHSVDQVDELLPSSSPPDSVAQLSPRHRRATLVNTSQSQPLFLDATQSDPLPVVLESQAEPAGKAVTQKLRKVSVNSSTNSSEEAREVELSVSVARKSLSQPTTGSSPGLGVFAGLQALKRRAFAMPQLMVSTQGNAPKKDAYGRIGKESESEEEDSEESPAEDASQSHIPTARTAGKVGRV